MNTTFSTPTTDENVLERVSMYWNQSNPKLLIEEYLGWSFERYNKWFRDHTFSLRIKRVDMSEEEIAKLPLD